MPVRPTVTVAGSLSLTFSDPVPTVNGVGALNRTRIWQFAPGLRLAGQLLLSMLKVTPFITFVIVGAFRPIAPGPTLPTVTACTAQRNDFVSRCIRAGIV